MWSLTDQVTAAPPWIFTVQESDDGRSAWRDLTTVTDLFAYSEPAARRIKFDHDLGPFFRIKAVLGGETSYGDATLPLSEISRTQWLTAREMIRQMDLTFRKGSGGSRVALWQKIRTGIKCSRCIDSVTGQVLDSQCEVCMGSGTIGGFYGPYPAWAQFSLAKPKKTQDDQVMDVRAYQVAVPAVCHCNREDLLVDLAQGRLYEVVTPEPAFELRRLPIAYSLMVVEVPPDREKHAVVARSQSV